jgi:hypothetical protein
MTLDFFQQGRLDETVINTTVARLLSDKFNIYAIPEERKDVRPDILAIIMGVPVAIEAVFEKGGARDEAKKELIDRLKKGFGEFGIAVVYPLTFSSPRPIPQLEQFILTQPVEASIWRLEDDEERCLISWRRLRLSELVYSALQIAREIKELVNVEELVKSVVQDIRGLSGVLRLHLGNLAFDIAKNISLVLGLAEPEDAIDVDNILSIACLTLFDASILYEVLASMGKTRGIKTTSLTIQQCKDAFKEALGINYVPIFDMAIKVLDLLPCSPPLDSFLRGLWTRSSEVAKKKYYLKHDLMGRLYHSLLEKGLAKVFATFFTKIPISEMLATLAIDKWDAKVIDPACGSGTLLVASYHRKLGEMLCSNSMLSLEEAHKKFIEEQLFGLDAMPFASHMTLTNLVLQMPEVELSTSNIFDVMCGGRYTGSLELLIDDRAYSRATITGDVVPVIKRRVMKEGGVAELEIPKGTFDVVIMNPPFTSSLRTPQNIGEEGSERLSNSLRRKSDGYKDLLEAGLAAPFVVLATELIKDEGRLALVLPVASLARSSWRPVRKMLMSGFDIEYLVISWEKGSPSFSDGSDFRELLLVARKSRDKNNTIIIHLDEQPKTSFEGAELGRKLRKISEWLRRAEPLASYPLMIEGYLKPLGEAIVIPRKWLEDSVGDMYIFLAFRDKELLKIFMSLIGISYDLRVPSFPLKELGKVVTIKSVIDHTNGLEILKHGSGYNAIWGSGAENVNTLEVRPTHVVRIIGKPKVHPAGKSGIFLLPRKLQIDTSAVFGVKATKPVVSNVWWPCEVGEDHAKLLSLWLNSTWGLLCLYGYREETRGTYGEYKKEHWGSIPVLDVTSLDSNSRKTLINLYDEVKEVRLPRLSEQLNECASYLRGKKVNEMPVRVKIDIQLARAFGYGREVEELLCEIYEKFERELEKLAGVMKK